MPAVYSRDMHIIVHYFQNLIGRIDYERGNHDVRYDLLIESIQSAILARKLCRCREEHFLSDFIRGGI